MDLLRPIQSVRPLPAAASGVGGPDGGRQEVRQRPGRQPGRADRLLRVLLDLPAAAGVHDDPRRSCSSTTRSCTTTSRTRCSASSRWSATSCTSHALSGKVTALVIGLLTSLWGGLGVTQAAQNAFNRVWAVPFKDRPDFLRSRLRGLLLLVSLGVLFVVSTVAHWARDGGRRAAGQGRRVRAHARGQLRPVRGRVPVPDHGRRSPRARLGWAPRWGPCSSRSSAGRRHLHQPRRQPRQQHVRDVRHRDRAARLAPPDRAAHAVRGRDQHGRGAPAVAAEPARAT